MTKNILPTLLISILLLNTHARAEVTEQPKTKIAEVKAWLEATPHETTCLDEYMQRRKNLGIQLGLSPLVISGIVAAGLLTGGFVGYQIYSLQNYNAGGFSDLAAMLGGAMIGGVAAVGAAGVETGTVISRFFKNKHLIRLIYEARTDGGEELNAAFAEFKTTYPASILTLEEFKLKIIELDQSGRACDGSIVVRKRYKKGKLLRQRIANLNEIFTEISR